MKKDLPGENGTYTTRRESYEKVNIQRRYSEIKYILKMFPDGLTAKQVAIQMKRLGYTDNTDRNNAAPRLTELSRIGYVEPIGKVKCSYTGKMVSVYKLLKTN